MEVATKVFEVREIKVICPLCHSQFTIVISQNVFDFYCYCPKCGAVLSKKEVEKK